jgi:hypothetical protein
MCPGTAKSSYRIDPDLHRTEPFHTFAARLDGNDYGMQYWIQKYSHFDRR